MRIQTESGPSLKPQVSILEKDSPTKVGKFSGHQEKVSELKIPVDLNKLKKFEYDELLTEARNRILNDGNFVAKLVSAMIEKSLSNRSVRKLAEIENSLVEICINLTDNDIDNLIEQLNMKTLQYISENKSSLNISQHISEDLHSGKWNPYSTGIKSVVHFIRERSKLLMSKPAQNFVIGFNNHLDVDRKIDLMEVIFGETDSDIEQLNLIQIKNSLPTEEEIAEITKEHEDYVKSEMMSLKDIEELKLPEERERQLFEETLSNQVIMIEKVFDICANYESIDQKTLIETLGLGNLNNLQKAWVLDTYFETIKGQVDIACSDGYIEEQKRDSLIQDLQSLRQTLISRAGVPLHITRINSVNSLIAIGPRIIKQSEIYNSQNVRGALAATI